MINRQEGSVSGQFGRSITYDITFPESNGPSPVVIFLHGFKGFKDWGPFGQVAQAFAEAGFVFLKFNFAFNGTTPDNLVDFSDLDAFSKNNFTRELSDLQQIVELVVANKNEWNIDENQVYLVGHSRGGGTAIIYAAGTSRIRGIAAWASVGDFGKFLSMADHGTWKKEGLIYVPNARTGQQMPVGYQLYEDFIQNSSKLDIAAAAASLKNRLLFVHGTLDETIPFSDIESLARNSAGSVFVAIPGANHTFGGSHPVESNVLPAHFALVVQETIDFFRTVPRR